MPFPLESYRERQLSSSADFFTGINVIQETLFYFPNGFLTDCNFTQDSPGPAPFKTKEPSPRIGKIQVIIPCLESSLPTLWRLYTCLVFYFCQRLQVFSLPTLQSLPLCAASVTAFLWASGGHRRITFCLILRLDEGLAFLLSYYSLCTLESLAMCHSNSNGLLCLRKCTSKFCFSSLGKFSD